MEMEAEVAAGVDVVRVALQSLAGCDIDTRTQNWQTDQNTSLRRREGAKKGVEGSQFSTRMGPILGGHFETRIPYNNSV